MGEREYVFLFLRNPGLLEESLVVSLIIVQEHTPTFGQTPETVCFNFD